MASADMNHAEKKFRSVSTTQDSIQSLSLWVLHHKAQHEKIVEVWFNVLKKSKTEHRLVLFYVCNDIVQTCKRKHAVVYKDAFKEVLKDASMLVRDHQIRNNVKRIYKIWRERGIYDQEFIDELIDIVENTKVQPAMSSKLLADFQPLALMEKVITLNRYENELEHKRRQLVNLRMDASSLEAVRQLKDRTHGKEFCHEFEGACTKIEDYVKCVEKEIADRNELIELLEQSELYYDAQYGEAKIVANAYKNFGGRVNTLAKSLNEKLQGLPDTVSPPYSPPDSPGGPEFSSPDVTPPRVEEITSPRPAPVEGEAGEGRHGVAAEGEVVVAVKHDNNEAVDMDLSDGEEGATQDSRGPSNEDEASYSPKSDTDPAPQASPIVDVHPPHKLDENMSIPSIAKGASKSFFGQEDVLNAMRDGEGVHEEGGSTPVMDEEEDESEKEPPKKKASPDVPVTKTNPIDFLTSLINSKTPGSSASSSTSFFQNLGVLVSTAKTEYKRDEPVTSSQGGSSEGSWANWKANEAASQLPQPPQPPYLPPQPPVPPYQGNQPAYAPQPGFNMTPYGTSGPGGPAPPGGPNVAPPFAAQSSSPNGGPTSQPAYAPLGTPGAPPNPPAMYGPPPGTPGNAAAPRPSYPLPPTPGAHPFRPSLSIPNSGGFEPPPGQNTSPQNAPYPPRGPSGDFRARGPYPLSSTPPTPPSFQTSGRYPPPRFPPSGPNGQNFPGSNFPGSAANQAPRGTVPTTPDQPGPPTSGPPTPIQQGPGAPRQLMLNHQGPPTPGGYRPPHPPGQQGFTNRNAAPGLPPASQPASGWPHSQGPARHHFSSQMQNKTNLTTIKTVEYSEDSDMPISGVPASVAGGVLRFPQPPIQGHRPIVPHTAPHNRPQYPPTSLPEDAIALTSENSAFESQESGGEGQQEFIDKLRRKSNVVGETAPNPPFERQLSNLRTLTEVAMDISDEKGEERHFGEEGEGDSQLSIGSFLSHMRRESDEKAAQESPENRPGPPRDREGWHPLDSGPPRPPGPRPLFRPEFRPRGDFNLRPFRLGGGPRFNNRFPGPRPPRPPTGPPRPPVHSYGPASGGW